MGLTALSGALCYGELASRFPRRVAPTSTCARPTGRPSAFLYGWKCLLVMDPGITAALATGLGGYVARPVPDLAPKVVAVVAIVACGRQRAGVRLAARVSATASGSPSSLCSWPCVAWGSPPAG